jgi:hypothetical protein
MESLRERLLEAACALRDEGQPWEQIAERLPEVSQATLYRWVREHEPELALMSTRDLRRRHIARRRFWYELNRRFPVTEERTVDLQRALSRAAQLEINEARRSGAGASRPAALAASR